MAKLEISLFGSFQVLLNGAPVTAFESVKVRALLAYLAAEASHTQPRERLAELLWPDWPQQSAMSNLRYALADLRKVIGDRDAQPPFLLITRESIQLNRDAEMRVDVAEFESAFLNPQSSISNQQSAISLYRGPFLDGFPLPDSAPFEEWLLAKREYFSQQALKILSHLAEWGLKQGEYDQAEGYAHRQIELEPWCEKAYQQLMHALSLKGERVQALAQYESLRKALQRELNVEPSEDTLQLYRQIQDGKLEVRKEVLVDKPRHNLPRQLTRFIGREQEIAQVMRLVRQNPLITLIGSGGVGKTRLALATAEALLDDFQDGVWLVELASLTDPDRIPQAVANTLGVLEKPERSILDTLSLYFRDRETLLVLDNCEYLVEACALLANMLLSAAPQLKMLITSREALGMPGEMVYRVPSLLFPPPGQALEVEVLQQYEAVHLFLDRARAVAIDFQLNAGNSVSVAQICQRLDGIPLAIELAATRISSLEVAQIAARLDNAFSLLAGGSRAALERHRTLRATVDWSYNLLSAPERILLQRLSVFAGGWTLEAAEEISADQGVNKTEVLNLLSQLVNKSILLVERSTDTGLRYRILETIRQYAVDKLVETGESERLHTRHLAYFVVFAERIEDGLRGPELVGRLNRLEAELNNLRLALEWGLQTDVLSELRLASALMWFWHIHSNHRNEGIDWLQQGLEAEAASRNRQENEGEVQLDANRAFVRAKALSAFGLQLEVLSTNTEKAITMLEESLTIYRMMEGDHRWWIAFDLSWLAYSENDPAHFLDLINQSQALFEEIGDKNRIGDCLQFLENRETDLQKRMQISVAEMAIQKESGDIDGIATAAQQLGWSFFLLGDFTRAGQCFQESFENYKQVGNQWSMANLLSALGHTTCSQGDHSQAELYFSQAADMYQEVGDFTSYTVSILEKILDLTAVGFYEQTHVFLEIALKFGRELSNDPIIAQVGLLQARLDWMFGDLDQAAQRLEEARVILKDNETISVLISPQHLSGRLALSRGDLSLANAHFKGALQHFAQYSVDVVIFLDDLASLAVRPRDMERAARLFGACDGLSPSLIYAFSPIERGWREQDIKSARSILGNECYQAQFDLGRAMSLEQAVAYALGESEKLEA
jgi:predicted ATPase/DNA-binding SARP family transcriptional activator